MYSKFVSSILGRPKSDEAKKSSSKKKKAASTEVASDQSHAHSQSGHASSCTHCQAHINEYNDEMKAQAFIFSWNCQYLGSFPISNVEVEHVSYRLEKFCPVQKTDVCLSASMAGVRVHSGETVLLSHSMRRVCSVACRIPFNQVAYIAMESSGQIYRKQCHVFRTSDKHQCEEIEGVIANAFQAHAMSTKIKLLGGSQRNSYQSTPLSSMPAEKRSSAFLSRILGGKGRETVIVDDQKTKRKRRPVSAVFSSALHRLSSTASVTNKRMTTIESPQKEKLSERIVSPVPEEPTPTALRELRNEHRNEHRASRLCESSSSTSTLVFDENLKEWIFPMDSVMQTQLEGVNYFVKSPSRELLHRNLLSQPEGAFVLRISESRTSCLALTVRVPYSDQPSGIRNYLIIRNQNGYRIKSSDKFFPSMQVLITHHSVMQEKLPVPLRFVQWNANDWTSSDDENNSIKNNRHSKIYSHTKLADVDENRNSYCYTKEYRGDEMPFYHHRTRSHEYRADETTRTKQYIDDSMRNNKYQSKRQSRLFDIDMP